MVDRQIGPTTEIPPIPPISGIGGIDPITTIPGVPAISPPGLLAFKFGDLPFSVQPLIKKGTSSWPKAVDEAIAKGIKDVDKLADLIFFMHHPERVRADGFGKPIDPNEKGAVRLLAERQYHGVVAQRRLTPAFVPPVFLAEKRSSQYEDFVAAKTTGLITLMVNGRRRPKTGKEIDVSEVFKDMQANVEMLQAGDTMYLATWEFESLNVPLQNPNPLGTWGPLLKQKATQGVRIRVIVSIHPQVSTYDLTPLDNLIRSLPAAQVDNLKYLASAHPGSFILGRLPAADHHQKFLILKRGKATIAWCGGLDITQARTPQYWSDDFVWHDVHARLEGKIVKDLEREFVERWNREKDLAINSSYPTTDSQGNKKVWEAKNIVGIWKNGFETLTASPVESADTGSNINTHDLQVLRTVAIAGPLFPPTKRDDIWQGYHRLIGRASRFLFLENQYFHEPRLATALVTQMQAQPSLVVMIVIATGNNDDTNHPYVKHLFTLRNEFFQKLLLSDRTLSSRIGVYTMFYRGGIVHSKLIIADDEVLSMGSANATQRSFYLDSELNVMLENPRAVKAFRVKLWAHNLDEPESDVEKWSPSQFLQNWKKVTDYNKARRAKPKTMVGEGIDEYSPLSPSDPKSILRVMRKWSVAVNAQKSFPDIDFDVAF